MSEKVKDLLSQPVSKFYQIVGEGKALAEDNIFENSLKPSRRSISDIDRFRALRDVYKGITDPTVQLRDENLATETRRLFESNESLLKTNFVEGLQGIKDRILESPNPDISRKMFSQLCGIAYSLPSSSQSHPIGACEGALPPGMSNYLKNPKEIPDCSYYRYLQDQVRRENFDTDRKSSLPSESPSSAITPGER